MITRRTLFHMAAGAAAARAAQAPGTAAQTSRAANVGERSPLRKTGMIVRSVRPEDLEMPLEFFNDYLTPAEHFFVRTHTYAPSVSLQEWRLSIDGLVDKPVTLTMADLKAMPLAELMGVLECAGNGRGLYVPTMPGLQWTYGAVGNARWTGVRLADVLKRAGLKGSATEVLFDGADSPLATMPDFQRTIPVKKALDPNTLLAWDMNGRPLPMQHGYPLRLIVPGWAGDSWVKWVTKITLLDHEFDGFFMKTAYRHPGKPVPPGTAVPPEQMFPVTSLRVKSVISSPAHGAVLEPGKPVRISGAAWSGDAGPVQAVEVSTDAGKSWTPAQLAGEPTPFGWRLWSLQWTPPAEQHYTLMARARSVSGDIQPFEQEWNPSGYQWNVVHKVGVSVGNVYRKACLVCHQNDVVEQQRLTRAQWEREVDKMIRWGAKVDAQDRNSIIDYLVTHYGPR
jgi:DMSO/TMAO reductase YedYZ molybdopterin-dependent catalytic subunit